MSKLMLETPNASQKGIHNRLLAAFENVVRCAVQKVVYWPEFISRFMDAVIDDHGFIAPLAALVNSEQQKFVTEPAKI